jgi:nitroimidazol reductase NimA-like FMN-containing flavoprotein (pyridoxamine 5'-phosphate oxidase superfamily)
MQSRPVAVFRDLTRAESEAILSRNHVGRIAYSFHDRVDVEPIHYVYDEGWIYGRTALGAKLVTLSHHRWVAFEVDEIEGLFDWRSVIVHGAVYVLGGDDPALADPALAHGLALLRRLLPETLTEADPAPFRTVLFRVYASEITGREASMTRSAGTSGNP